MTKDEKANVAITVTHIDKLVGDKLKSKRLQIGYTRSYMAEISELKEKNIQEFENGLARIPARILLIFAKLLEVPPEYFFKEESASTDTLNYIGGEKDLSRFLALPESDALVSSFIKVEGHEQRLDIIEYVKALAELSRKLSNGSK